MESFNANLQGGKKLVKSLEKQSVRSTTTHRTRRPHAPGRPPARPHRPRARHRPPARACTAGRPAPPPAGLG